MLPDEFLQTEHFFRGLHQDQFNAIERKVFSSAFKDSLGVSVDRSWDRSDSNCISFLLAIKNFSGIAKVSVPAVLECLAHPIYKRLEENEFHSEIHDTADSVTLGKSKARCVSSKSDIVYDKK